MKTFLRGLLIFLMVVCGVAGVMTVDVRSGHMAGYQPAIDMNLTEVSAEVPEGVEKDSPAVSYNLTVICNKKLLFWDKSDELLH